MASTPISTILEEHQVSPPPATAGNHSLPLTFYDILWLTFHPIHTLFFYEVQITKSQFIETLIPSLKNSLSITLQHFYPFAGKLIVFPTPAKKPEIRYVEGDSVVLTVAESTFDFSYLTGNHPRDCDQFYHLIPTLGKAKKESDHVSIAVFSLQVTFFPNSGFSIGLTNHHSLCDATTRFSFLKAWTSIAQSGNDESFLASGSLPCFDRLINYPKLDESYLKKANLESINEDYQPPSLSAPSGLVRVTVILKRTVINKLKELVSTQLPELQYVSSFTVACGYIWSCIAKARNDEKELFSFPVECRRRLDPPIPASYFGNCFSGCLMVEKTNLITGPDGFVTAAKLIGENLHKVLTDKDGVVKDLLSLAEDLYSDGVPTTMLGIAGTPRHKFYDLDFGWGKPKKHEAISMDYGGWISVNASKESNEDLEIGVCLPATEMDAFIVSFKEGLEAYI